jgi:hypothetical protein
MRRARFQDYFAALYLEDRKDVFEQYALCWKVGKLAKRLLELYLKTAKCQYLGHFELHVRERNTGTVRRWRLDATVSHVTGEGRFGCSQEEGAGCLPWVVASGPDGCCAV